MNRKPPENFSWSPSGDEHFTGSVWNSRVVEGDGGITMIAVQFAPGGRSDWHTHPAGQVLYTVSGSDLVQTEDGWRIEITAGDVVFAPPG
jgi:quercetin dioxygenase-like cupin family protein